MKKRIIIRFFSTIFILSIMFAPAYKAKAILGVGDISFDPSDFITDIWTNIESTYTSFTTEFMKTISGKTWYKDLYESKMLPILKKAAIQKVNEMTTEVVTGGNSGKPYFVTNWQQQLISGPEQEAKLYVNSLLDKSLSGRASSANYSNSGYYSYLKKQTVDSINPPTVNVAISSSSGDLRAGMFGGGNMKAFNEFLGTGNNPHSLSLIAASALEKRTEDNKLIAQNEHTNGYIPKKDAFGNIMTPAAVFENTYNSASNMGREMVSNATRTDELLGAVVNLVVQSAMKPLKEGLVKAGSSEGVTQVTAGINNANGGINTVNGVTSGSN